MAEMYMSVGEIQASYLDALKPSEQIGILAELNDCKVEEICDVLGVDVPKKRSRRGRTKFAWSEDDIEAVRRMLADGKEIKEIAGYLGAPYQNVYEKARKIRRENKEKKMENFRMTADIADRITDLKAQGLTWVEIALRVGHDNHKSLQMCYSAFIKKKNGESASSTASGPPSPKGKAEAEGESDTDCAPSSVVCGDNVPPGEDECTGIASMAPSVSAVMKLFGIEDCICECVEIDYKRGLGNFAFEKDGKKYYIEMECWDEQLR